MSCKETEIYLNLDEVNFPGKKVLVLSEVEAGFNVSCESQTE